MRHRVDTFKIDRSGSRRRQVRVSAAPKATPARIQTICARSTLMV